MTATLSVADLAAQLAPIAAAAVEADDPDVLKVGVVLAAVMGCIAEDGAPQRELLDALAINAGMICDHARGHRR